MDTISFFELYGQPRKMYFAESKDFGGDPARMRKYFRDCYSYYKLPPDADPRLKFLKKNISRANNRKNGWEIKIDEFDAYMIGQKQGWLCAVTKQPLEFERGGEDVNNTNPMSCTIDRIDSNFGYVPGNIQLVIWKYNRFKSNWSVEDLKLFCHATLAIL